MEPRPLVVQCLLSISGPMVQSLHVCACIHRHTHAPTHAHTHTEAHTCTHTGTNTYEGTHRHTHAHIQGIQIIRSSSQPSWPAKLHSYLSTTYLSNSVTSCIWSIARQYVVREGWAKKLQRSAASSLLPPKICLSPIIQQRRWLKGT